MALIDRTEFVRNLSRIPGWADADGDTLVSVADIRSLIYQARTVDAVPVEWMRDKMRGYASSLKSTETAALVMVMQMWQKEREAR